MSTPTERMIKVVFKGSNQSPKRVVELITEKLAIEVVQQPTFQWLTIQTANMSLNLSENKKENEPMDGRKKE
jgi:hypothetical protein